MTPEDMKTAMYESDAEQARERIASTVDDLQYRLNPRNMVNDAVGSLQERGKDMVDSAKSKVRGHPIAASAIALTAGALLLGRRKMPKKGDYSFNAYEDVYGGTMNDGYEPTAPAADDRPGVVDRARVRASEARASVSESAHAARDYTAEKLSAARERTSELSERAKVKASEAKRRAADEFDHNPITGALIGVAAGALLGMLLPRTRRENELMGETRDRLSDAAKAAARAAADTAKQELDDRGLTIDSAKAKLAEVGEQAKVVAKTAAETAANEARARTRPSVGTSL